MNPRIEYTVIKDFEDTLPMGISDVTYSYKVGDKVRLRYDGAVAKKWLEKGYIK